MRKMLLSLCLAIGCAGTSSQAPAPAPARQPSVDAHASSSGDEPQGAAPDAQSNEGRDASGEESVARELDGTFDPADPPSVPVYDPNAKATRAPETSRAAGCDTSKDPLCEAPTPRSR